MQIVKSGILGVPAEKAGGPYVTNKVHGTPMKIKEK